MSSDESSESEYLPTKKEATLNVIGALALDIRGNWAYDVSDRLDLIIELSEEIDRRDLAKWIRRNVDDIMEDGRTMRDWPGPYGNCSHADLELISQEPEIFSSPDCVISDY